MSTNTTYEKQWNGAAGYPEKQKGFLSWDELLCVVSGCTPGPFKMESSSLREGKKKTGHKVLIRARCKVHPATEKLSLKAHLACALEGFLEAAWVLNHPCHDRNIFLYMLCLPKSLSYERFCHDRGDWGTVYPLMCVRACVCVVNARLTV